LDGDVQPAFQEFDREGSQHGQDEHTQEHEQVKRTFGANAFPGVTAYQCEACNSEHEQGAQG